MKQTFNKILAGGAILFTAAACTGDYLDINSNQSQPGDLSADGFALVSSMSNICGSVIPMEVHAVQFVECLCGGTLGGYFSDGANFQTSFVHNNATDDWVSCLLTNKNIIPALYTNITEIEGYCETSGEVVPLAVANIVKVAAMHRVADTYGPIPYSAIGVDGNVQTAYDSQPDTYKKFFEEIAENRQVLLDNKTAAMSPLADKVYGGDVEKWIRFANSLQLRLALRISYADPTLAKQKAEDAVNPANGGVIESNDQNALWNNYQAGNSTFLEAIMYNAHDSRPSAEIACYLNGYNDPRMSKYLTVSATGSDAWSEDPEPFKDADGNWMTSPDGVSAEYIGIRRGWANETFNTTWSKRFSDIIYSSNQPALWMNASEVCFLRAEGVAVFGWDMGGSAENFYNEGIRLSMENYGVADGYADYIADDTSVPAQFYDPTGLNPWNGRIPAVTIKWDDSLTAEQKQEKIITQKWLANWLLGNEAWADYRRTGYPFLIPIAYNGSPDVDINRGPQRLPYPQSEYTGNLANVQKAVADYLKGPDTYATRLWWACKPGL